MKQITIIFASLACLLLMTQVGFAQQTQGVEAAVNKAFPKEATVPMVRFVPPNTEETLNKIGKFFFGGPLTAEMAEEDTGRYLYFTDEYSRLWYYPMSGAFEWVRIEPPIKAEFDTSDENIDKFQDLALVVIKAIRGDISHPMESIEFERNSRVHAFTGTYASEGNDIEHFVRRVDVRFRQTIAGMPVFQGSWAVVSFCGDTEICGVKVLLRDIAEVAEHEILPIEKVTSGLLTFASELDGRYYVSHVDQSIEPIVGYITRAESYLQMAAAPMLIIPVCQSLLTATGTGCEMKSSIAQPLVDDYEILEGAFAAKTVYEEGEIQKVIKPSHCEDSSEAPECAP